MMHWIAVHHILLYAIALSAIFAFWKGGWAERTGGLANLACAGAWIIAKASLSPDRLAIAELGIDCILSFTFLGLALRFASRWLGVAMLLQAAQFSLHAYYFVAERGPDLLRATVNNVVSWGIVLCILTGVLAAWSRNARAAPRHRAA
jgi:hypothetical protein